MIKKRLIIFLVSFLIFIPSFSIAGEEAIELPILGEVDLSQFSLPILAIVLGSIDGLNVCSLGALIIVLSIVLVFKKRSLILIFGGTFLIVVTVVYGILVFIWYQIFSFILPYFSYMKALISLMAFFGGIYFFKEFLRLRKFEQSCKMGQNKVLQKTTNYLQHSFEDSKKSIFFLILAVILFASVATIIEFPCSLAIPVIFTGILANFELGAIEYSFYIFLYLFFYLLDEAIIFIVAVFTKKIWFSSGRLAYYFTLLGSLVMFYIAYYYSFGGA